jgi:hypothetical protein
MSNIKASEENTESPSTYGNEAYKEYRKTKKKDEKKEQPDSTNQEQNENL